MPALLEFSPYFRDNVLGEYVMHFEQGLEKAGILLYLGILISLVGIGEISSIASISCLTAAVALAIYNCKHQIYEKLGMSYEMPKIEEF